MTIFRRHNTAIINVLVALVVSLVINFSYLLAVRQNDYSYLADDPYQTLHSGTLHVSKDGYGYVVCDEHIGGAHPGADALPDSPASDSVYVSWRNISLLKLVDGDRMKIIPRPSRFEGGNPMLAVVSEVNGVPFDYRAVYSRPGDDILFGLQFGYFFLLSLILLFVMTTGARKHTSWRFFIKRGGIALVIAAAMFFLMPVMRFRTEEIVPIFSRTNSVGVLVLDPVAILKCSFVLVFVLLYGRTYQLIHQREGIVLENEQLKNENLKARYNTLVNQMNPHFLFNSLNSLSALVREGRAEDAVTYIDRLADAFRYAIRTEPQMTATLDEELEFVAAYKYLLEVRYDEKLFIDIDIPQDARSWTLPAFSVQPLIENAVKHNTITRATPLRVSIRIHDDKLVVSNPINPKIEPEKSTCIGLANLSSRWQLLTGKEIEITDDGRVFSVTLPLSKTEV